MAKSSEKRPRKSKTDDLFMRADKLADEGDLKSAFRLFLAAAKAGDSSCQINLGNFYDDGKGVRRNRSAAMFWYKRAYRRGESSAAHNIGVMWRNEKKHRRALEWFKKAVKLGDDEANLEIAKHYLEVDHNPRSAIPHLRKVCESNWVTEAGRAEANTLLRRARKRANRV
jgi:tetratricopeptide (TPR) repeat protein